MNNVEKAIKLGGQAAAGVFSGFGGFLLNVQPPEGVLKTFTIGFASTLSALLFLLISLLSRRYASGRYRGIFVVLSVVLVAVVAVAGFRYQSMFARLTLDLPSGKGTEKIIIGTEFTPIAGQKEKESGEPLSQLVLDFGGKSERERIWTRASLDVATLELNNGYVLLAVSVAATIFCLAEALFPTKEPEN